jgi:hypothetical protein
MEKVLARIEELKTKAASNSITIGDACNLAILEEMLRDPTTCMHAEDLQVGFQTSFPLLFFVRALYMFPICGHAIFPRRLSGPLANFTAMCVLGVMMISWQSCRDGFRRIIKHIRVKLGVLARTCMSTHANREFCCSLLCMFIQGKKGSECSLACIHGKSQSSLHLQTSRSICACAITSFTMPLRNFLVLTTTFM